MIATAMQYDNINVNAPMMSITIDTTVVDMIITDIYNNGNDDNASDYGGNNNSSNYNSGNNNFIATIEQRVNYILSMEFPFNTYGDTVIIFGCYL